MFRSAGRMLTSKYILTQISKKLSINIAFLNSTRQKMAVNTVGSESLLFRQLFDRCSCTYTYLLADKQTGEAILIDPVIELVDRDIKLMEDLNVSLKYAANTHVHADHITGSGLLKKMLPDTKSLLSKAAGAIADVLVEPFDIVKFGDHELEVRGTPGHTNGCITYVSHKEKVAFTGDALLIRGCGRTDFQEGSSENLYNSVYSQIFSLPDDYLVFPAHDYKGQTMSTVGEEKKLNPRLSKSKEEFVQIMDELGLPYPVRIDESLPANKVCGLHSLPPKLEEFFNSKVEAL